MLKSLVDLWSFLGEPRNAAAIGVVFAVIAGLYTVGRHVASARRDKEREITRSEIAEMIAHVIDEQDATEPAHEHYLGYDEVGRVAQLLLTMARRREARVIPKGMEVDLSVQQLAEMTGIHPDQVVKVLASLEAQSLITKKGDKIGIWGTDGPGEMSG